MKCENCGVGLDYENIIIQEDFDCCYCRECGEFIGKIVKKVVEEKNNRVLKGIISIYIGK